MELNDPEWDTIIRFYWEQMSFEFQNETNDYEIVSDLHTALKYNFYRDFEQSESIYYYALHRYTNDFGQFLCSSFLWSASSINDEFDNFIYWFEKIFGRGLTIDPTHLLKNKFINIRNFDSPNGLIYDVHLHPNDTFSEHEKFDFGVNKDFCINSNFLKGIHEYNELNFNDRKLLEFQIAISNFEIHVENSKFYYIDNILFLRGKEFITYTQIEALIPEIYYNRLDELGILHDYISELTSYYKVLIIPKNKLTYEYYKEFVAAKFINFADFVFKSFYWGKSINGIKGFSWWYKTVFGVEFEYEEGYGQTTHHVNEKIMNYVDSDSYSRKKYSDENEYSSLDSFKDAYSDGFNNYEDNKYYDM